MVIAAPFGPTRVSAPGKAVLLGEYVVLEGAPALVAAVDRRAYVTITQAASWALTAQAVQVVDAAFTCTREGRAQFQDPAVQASARLGTVRAVLETVQAALRQHGAALRPCHITIDTAAFLAADGTKLGLGSSAAVSVALVVGLLAHHAALDTVLPQAGLARQHAIMALAARVHARAQGGMGSGVDIAASTFGGVLRFERRGSQMYVTPCAPIPHLETVFTWAGHATSTPAFLAKVKAFKSHDPARHGALIDKLSTIARAGVEAWNERHMRDFLAAIAASFAGLAELGESCGADIASAKHRAMGAVAKASGAVYKSSGAGGGDLGVAFAASGPIAQAAAQALTDAHFSVLPLAFDPCGVQIDSCTSITSESP